MKFSRWTLSLLLTLGTAGTISNAQQEVVGPPNPGATCPPGASPTNPKGEPSNCSKCTSGQAACLGCCGAFTAGGPKHTTCTETCKTDHAQGTCGWGCV